MHKLNVLLSFLFCAILKDRLVNGYAQLADTMLCADKECSETISEGKARLAYRPRDDKFLNLEKGDVVLVKSKNAGKKSHLWGGQEFLKGTGDEKSKDLFAGLIGKNQKITVQKSKKKKPAEDVEAKKEDLEKPVEQATELRDNDGGSSVQSDGKTENRKEPATERDGADENKSADKTNTNPTMLPPDIAAIIKEKLPNMEGAVEPDRSESEKVTKENTIGGDAESQHGSQERNDMIDDAGSTDTEEHVGNNRKTNEDYEVEASKSPDADTAELTGNGGRPSEPDSSLVAEEPVRTITPAVNQQADVTSGQYVDEPTKDDSEEDDEPFEDDTDDDFEVEYLAVPQDKEGVRNTIESSDKNVESVREKLEELEITVNDVKMDSNANAHSKSGDGESSAKVELSGVGEDKVERARYDLESAIPTDVTPPHPEGVFSPKDRGADSATNVDDNSDTPKSATGERESSVAASGTEPRDESSQESMLSDNSAENENGSDSLQESMPEAEAERSQPKHGKEKEGVNVDEQSYESHKNVGDEFRKSEGDVGNGDKNSLDQSSKPQDDVDNDSTKVGNVTLQEGTNGIKHSSETEENQDKEAVKYVDNIDNADENRIEKNSKSQDDVDNESSKVDGVPVQEDNIGMQQNSESEENSDKETKKSEDGIDNADENSREHGSKSPEDLDDESLKVDDVAVQEGINVEQHNSDAEENPGKEMVKSDDNENKISAEHNSNPQEDGEYSSTKVDNVAMQEGKNVEQQNLNSEENPDKKMAKSEDNENKNSAEHNSNPQEDGEYKSSKVDDMTMQESKKDEEKGYKLGEDVHEGSSKSEGDVANADENSLGQNSKLLDDGEYISSKVDDVTMQENKKDEEQSNKLEEDLNEESKKSEGNIANADENSLGQSSKTLDDESLQNSKNPDENITKSEYDVDNAGENNLEQNTKLQEERSGRSMKLDNAMVQEDKDVIEQTSNLEDNTDKEPMKSEGDLENADKNTQGQSSKSQEDLDNESLKPVNTTVQEDKDVIGQRSKLQGNPNKETVKAADDVIVGTDYEGKSSPERTQAANLDIGKESSEVQNATEQSSQPEENTAEEALKSEDDVDNTDENTQAQSSQSEEDLGDNQEDTEERGVENFAGESSKSDENVDEQSPPSGDDSGTGGGSSAKQGSKSESDTTEQQNAINGNEDSKSEYREDQDVSRLEDGMKASLEQDVQSNEDENTPSRQAGTGPNEIARSNDDAEITDSDSAVISDPKIAERETDPDSETGEEHNGENHVQPAVNQDENNVKALKEDIPLDDGNKIDGGNSMKNETQHVQDSDIMRENERQQPSDAAGVNDDNVESKDSTPQGVDVGTENHQLTNLDLDSIPPPGPPYDEIVKERTGQSESEDTDDLESVRKEENTTEQVLQLDGMKTTNGLNSAQQSEFELLSGEDDADSGKQKVLHEGKLVDWDETIERKPDDKQPLTWDEEIGKEVEDDEHNVKSNDSPPLGAADNDTPSPTEPPVVDVTTPEYIPLDSTPDPHDIVNQQNEIEQTPEIVESNTHDSGAIDEIPPSNDEPASYSDGQTDDAEADGMGSDDSKIIVDESMLGEATVQYEESDHHVESFWVRLLIQMSSFPADVVYVCEPLFEFWISLLPPEYQNDVLGIPWPVILSTAVVGFFLIWILMWRSGSAKRRRRDEEAFKTIEELRTQLDNISKEKVDIENDLRTKQNEIEIHDSQLQNSIQDKENILSEKRTLEESLQQLGNENENLRTHLQQLTASAQEKDDDMRKMIANAQKAEKGARSQQQIIEGHEKELKKLRESLAAQDKNKKEADSAAEKLKERLKTLEKSKGEVKKEGKLLRDQIDKLNATVEELQQKLDRESEDREQRMQEIDVLKDCILQFKGAKEFLTGDDEDLDGEESLEKQKERMRDMLEVANVKKLLRQSEAEKLNIQYELQAEKEKRVDKETRLTQLEAVIHGDEVVKNKLERDVQTLESKLSVMQEFYAKREVEIQSKLGLEKSKLDSNTSLLEDKEKHQSELIEQLAVYKTMCDEAKQKYDLAERQHKQEVTGFEKKAYDNWYARRESEKKLDDANKDIATLKAQMSDLAMRLRASEHDFIRRPRPERYGPPGAPPFGPIHRPPGSPFEHGGPPPFRERSPKRVSSPGGSVSDDRPGSRPDRPNSARSLPPMDQRPPPGPSMGPGPPMRDRRPPSGPMLGPGPYDGPPMRDGRPPSGPPLGPGPYEGPRIRGGRPPSGPSVGPGPLYGIPPVRPLYRAEPPLSRPLPRDPHNNRRPPPDPGHRPPSGPMTSSPYMDRPPIPSSQSQAFPQSSLHATPPRPLVEGLRTDGYKPHPKEGPPGPPPGSNAGGGNR